MRDRCPTSIDYYEILSTHIRSSTLFENDGRNIKAHSHNLAKNHTKRESWIYHLFYSFSESYSRPKHRRCVCQVIASTTQCTHPSIQNHDAYWVPSLYLQDIVLRFREGGRGWERRKASIQRSRRPPFPGKGRRQFTSASEAMVLLVNEEPLPLLL